MSGDNDEVSTAHNPHSKLISLVGQRCDLTTGGHQKAVNVLDQKRLIFFKTNQQPIESIGPDAFSKKMGTLIDWAL
jgi:hypothetical protein